MDKLKQMVTAEYKAFEKEMSEKPAWEVFDRSFEIEYFKNCYNYIISQIGYEWTEEYLGDKDIAFFEKLIEAQKDKATYIPHYKTANGVLEIDENLTEVIPIAPLPILRFTIYPANLSDGPIPLAASSLIFATFLSSLA